MVMPIALLEKNIDKRVSLLLKDGRVLEGKLTAFGSRIGSLLFKLAVNDGMLTTLAADTIDIDAPTLDRLRSQCVRDTRQIHGVIDLQDAVQARED